MGLLLDFPWAAGATDSFGLAMWRPTDSFGLAMWRPSDGAGVCLLDALFVTGGGSVCCDVAALGCPSDDASASALLTIGALSGLAGAWGGSGFNGGSACGDVAASGCTSIGASAFALLTIGSLSGVAGALVSALSAWFADRVSGSAGCAGAAEVGSGSIPWVESMGGLGGSVRSVATASASLGAGVARLVVSAGRSALGATSGSAPV
jgi:hypothetical protein